MIPPLLHSHTSTGDWKGKSFETAVRRESVLNPLPQLVGFSATTVCTKFHQNLKKKKIHKAYANGKREEGMRDNKVNPWRRCSWMEHRIAIPASPFFYEGPVYKSSKNNFFYPIKWQHAWNIDIMKKGKIPWEMLESLHSSLQFSAPSTIPQRTIFFFRVRHPGCFNKQ